jgi:hypothetical protein
MIVEKDAASRADVLNCGVNLARYRYVGAVEVGTEFDADALLRAMSAPLRNPATVVAATSHLETSTDGPRAIRGASPVAMGLTGTLQRLESIRSLMDSRVAWHMLQGAFGPQDAVVVWRRDSIVQLGGFSTAAADQDLDMMVRLQTADVPAASGRVVRSPEIFGRIDPRPVSATMRSAARRQLAAIETLWASRTLKTSGDGIKRTIAYFILSELVTPIAEAWVVGATLIGAAVHWFLWRDALLAIVLLSLGHALVTSAALLLRGAAPAAPDTRTLRYLLLAAPLEFVVSGTSAAIARVSGLLSFVRGAVAPEPGA